MKFERLSEIGWKKGRTRLLGGVGVLGRTAEQIRSNRSPNQNTTAEAGINPPQGVPERTWILRSDLRAQISQKNVEQLRLSQHQNAVTAITATCGKLPERGRWLPPAQGGAAEIRSPVHADGPRMRPVERLNGL
jgi:hypothetical protein